MIDQTFTEICVLPQQNQFSITTSSSIIRQTLQKYKLSRTNITYKLKNNCLIQLPFSSRSTIYFHSQSDKAVLLGQQYTYNKRLEFINAFQQIIWFSYRRLSQYGDAGWGCTIRVVQMMLAEVISRNQEHIHPNSLIDMFRDEKHGQLSLTNICQLGNIDGRWTSAPEIMMIVSSIIMKMSDMQQLNLKSQLFCQQVNIQDHKSYKKEDFPKLIGIFTRLGQQKYINQQYLYHLQRLMSDKRFVGIASGQNTQALYITGIFNEQAIFLDPHYVQQCQSYSTFFSKNPQKIKFTQLSSQCTIGYYIKSLQDFQQWVQELIQSDRYSTTPCFKLTFNGKWINNRKGSDDFQLL